jgi:uncharacterized membrane protein
MYMDLKHITDVIGLVIDSVGVICIALGVLVSTVLYLVRIKHAHSYTKFRESLGKVILLGLEFLIAGDIIRTVVVEPSLNSVGVLAVIVFVRTVLGMVLQMEITGRWPWQGGK